MPSANYQLPRAWPGLVLGDTSPHKPYAVLALKHIPKHSVSAQRQERSNSKVRKVPLTLNHNFDAMAW